MREAGYYTKNAEGHRADTRRKIPELGEAL